MFYVVNITALIAFSLLAKYKLVTSLNANLAFTLIFFLPPEKICYYVITQLVLTSRRSKNQAIVAKWM